LEEERYQERLNALKAKTAPGPAASASAPAFPASVELVVPPPPKVPSPPPAVPQPPKTVTPARKSTNPLAVLLVKAASSPTPLWHYHKLPRHRLSRTHPRVLSQQVLRRHITLHLPRLSTKIGTILRGPVRGAERKAKDINDILY
jgi:hypothetical protein